MKVLIKTLICALFALGAAEYAVAIPVLELVEHTEVRPRQNSNVKASSEERQLRVTLGKNYLVTESKDRQQIIDFEKRRIFEVNQGQKTYTESSLFSVLGFNAMELNNRVALNKMMTELKTDAATLTPALAEHLFSLQAPGQNTAITSARESGNTEYRWQGTPLVTISDQSQSLPAAYLPQYWKWVRYRLGGHPKIHAEFAARTGAPMLLKVVRQDVAESIVTQRLNRVTDAPDTGYSLAGLTRVAPEREPHTVLRRIAVDSGPVLKSTADAALVARDAAAAQAKWLDASLAHLAHGVMTGNSGTEWLAQMRDKLAADQDVRTLFSSVSASNAEQGTKAVAALSVLRAKTESPYGYMLDLYAANHNVALRRPADAQKLFLATLTSNPYLVGAWFDMGQMYYTTFQTAEAWACWDAARALSPAHPFRAAIDNMERKMVADRPEFF